MKQLLILLLCSSVISFTASAQVKVIAPAATKPLVKKTAIPLVVTKKVDLENIEEWLCPSRHTRGDREFDGHGPKIKCEVKLRIGRDSTSLWADITFWAQETVHDWSTVEGSWSKKVFDAPYGEKILKIKSDKASRTQFTSPAAGFQFLFSGEDVKGAMKTFFDGTQIANAVLMAHGFPSPATVTKGQIAKLISVTSSGNTVVSVPATDGALVKFFHIVGDTGGDDISNDDNCNDDTRITKIEFFPVQVEVRKTGN